MLCDLITFVRGPCGPIVVSVEILECDKLASWLCLLSSAEAVNRGLERGSR